MDLQYPILQHGEQEDMSNSRLLVLSSSDLESQGEDESYLSPSSTSPPARKWWQSTRSLSGLIRLRVSRPDCGGRGPLYAVLALFILVAGGVGTFLCWPRQPDFNIVSFELDRERPTNNDGDVFFTNWIVSVSVANKNYFEIDVAQLDVKAYLPQDRTAAVGNGTASDLKFPARKPTTAKVNFSIPAYAPSSGLPSIFAECLQSPTVDILLVSRMRISLLRLLRFNYSKHLTQTIDCALPAFAAARRQSWSAGGL